MMAEYNRQYNIQRATWERLLVPIENLLKQALKQSDFYYHNFKETENWIRMRWDMADVTISWHSDGALEEPNRNIHAWINGEWPKYVANFEGAAWKDDDNTRRVLFYPSNPSNPVTGNLLASKEPKGINAYIDREHDVLHEVLKLVDSVSSVKDHKFSEAEPYPLEPEPSFGFYDTGRRI